MATPAVAISIGGESESIKRNAFTLKLEDFVDERLDENEETTTTHHVLKFHPADFRNGSGLWADGTNEWLFQRKPPPPLSDAEKKN